MPLHMEFHPHRIQDEIMGDSSQAPPKKITIGRKRNLSQCPSSLTGPKSGNF